MMEGLVWASLLTLLVKRRIGMSVQQLAGIELSINGVNNTRRDIDSEKNMAKNHQFFVKICSKSEPDKR
jgi:hypothetical protein